MAKGGKGKGARRRHLQPRDSKPSGTLASAAGKQARRNMAKQVRQVKTDKVLSARRGTADGAMEPRVLVLVSAGEGAETEKLADQILACGAEGDGSLGGGDVVGNATVFSNGQRFTVVRPTRRVESVLDAMKAGDIMLLVIPADGGLDELGEQIVDAICMQGVGSVVGVLTGVSELPEKRQLAARKEWAASLLTRFPDHSKFFCLDADPDCAALLRHIAGIIPKQLSWREQRAYLLAQAYAYTPDAGGGASSAEAGGVLEVTGHVRGLDLSSERLLHIPGVGDFPIERAQVSDD